MRVEISRRFCYSFACLWAVPAETQQFSFLKWMAFFCLYFKELNCHAEPNQKGELWIGS